MKNLNVNFSNRENNEKQVKNSTSSLPSLKQQANINNTTNKTDKLKILFTKIQNFDPATTNNQKTNFNSKSTNNLPLDLNLKISDFSSRKRVNLNELNLKSIHHSPAESVGNWRFKNSSSNPHKFSTAEHFYNSPLDQKSLNINIDKSNDILEYKKKHANNIILMKKSQTKYKGKKAKLFNMNKYALLSNYEGNFKFRSEFSVNKEQVIGASKKTQLEHEEHRNLDVSRTVKKNINNSRTDQYNSADCGQAHENASTSLKKNGGKTKQSYPAVKNVKSLCINRAESKLIPSNNRIKEINEQTENIKSKEEYYRRIQEITKLKPSDNTSSVFTSAKNFERLSIRMSFRKSEFDFKMDLNAENIEKESEKEQNLSELGLFNFRKKSKKISLYNNLNASHASPIEEKQGKNVSILLPRSSSMIINQENLRRSASININQEKSHVVTKPKNRFKSTFFLNKEEHGIAEVISPGLKTRKSHEIIFNTNTQLLLEAITQCPKEKVRKPSQIGINASPSINTNTKQSFRINLENQIRPSLRPSCLQAERGALKKYSNKLLQTDSFPVNIGAEAGNSIPYTIYKANALTSSSVKIPNLSLPREDSPARFETSHLLNNQAIEKHKRHSLIYNSQNLAMLTEYEKDLIQKIKIVKNFVNSQSSHAFKSEKPNYKRIYVLQDGTTILKDLNFNGRFVDIPNKKHLFKHSSQLERYEIFVNFLEDASREFNVHPKFAHIFTLNGNQVFDLNDLHEEEKSCYVSRNSNFRGIHLLSSAVISRLKIRKRDMKLLYHEKVDISNTRHKKKHCYPFSKQTDKTQLIRIRNFKKIDKKIDFVEPEATGTNLSTDNEYDIQDNSDSDSADEVKNSHETNKSFTCDSHLQGQSSSFDDYAYLSESDPKKELASKKLSKYQDNLFELILYFSQINIAQITSQIAGRNSPCYSKAIETEASTLIQKYNKVRHINLFNKYTKPIKPKKGKKKLNYSTNTAAILIRKFLEHLNLLKLEKDPSVNYYNIDKAKSNKNKYSNINRKYVENLYFKIDHDVDRFLPDLVAFDIPRLIEEFPNVSRVDLYQMFIQYKTLLKISIAMNNSMSIMKKGVDFETFFNTIPNMKIYGKEMASNLFRVINQRKTNFLELDEFLRGMLMLRMRKKEIEESYVENNSFKWD